ncbi:MAG: AmmeMemoRadiSam system protein A [Oscillospiraceae bacterium]|nr:AmmeMemoRadiSam system protein A [Oscillospiraceae bacterium]
MAIVRAYTLPHPPLAVPTVSKGKGSKEIADTLSAMDEVAREIASIAPETIIYITPHGTVYSDYFHISPGKKAYGDLERFGAHGETFETYYDLDLVSEIIRVAQKHDIYAGTQGEKDAKLDHGVTVPMWYINQHYNNYQSVRVSQSAMASVEHYMLGQVIAEAAENKERKVVLIASSDLSHKLSAEGPYGFSAEGPKFDSQVIKALEKADFLSLFDITDEFRERAGECGYNSLMILAGCFDRQNVDAKLLSYEGPFGVGYAVARFCPTVRNERKNILEQYINSNLEKIENMKNIEDEYQNLARKSLEHMVMTGEEIPTPGNISDELIKRRAGVFVSIYKNNRLRGCIGTIAPTKKCVADEIIQNAISAGMSDTRFEPVQARELPLLTYKVDVLSAPELISGREQLDVKRYGVIVTSGYKRGLLLPNLDGIDTVDDQIDIARKKAGISHDEKIKLERFKVIRHE